MSATSTKTCTGFTHHRGLAKGGLLTRLCCFQVRPQIMLAGAAQNGTDLTIHAQIADNRRALMAAIPHTGAPLSPGQHVIKLSLNGQQFLDPSMDQPMVGKLVKNSCMLQAQYLLH